MLSNNKTQSGVENVIVSFVLYNVQEQNEGNSSDSVEQFQRGSEAPEVETRWESDKASRGGGAKTCSYPVCGFARFRHQGDEGPLRWGDLHQHISQKVIALEKFTEELQTRSSPVDKEVWMHLKWL